MKLCTRFELLILLLSLSTTRPLKMSRKSISSFFQPVLKKQKIDDPPASVSFISTSVVVLAASSSRDQLVENTHIESVDESELDGTDLHDEPLKNVFDLIEPSWRQVLQPEYCKTYFNKLNGFLLKEMKSHTVFPPKDEIFSAFNLCSFEDVKVVVIGQDPYHGPNQAHGLAFSVKRGIAIPPSLQNMIKEAKNDPALNVGTPTHGNLESWSRQGVLMLNTCLTVRKGEANSHQKQGWEEFTDAVVRELGKKEGLVYLLWGKPAQTKCRAINAKKNCIITSSHPSPLAAYKTDEPFITSRCFSRCNEWLTAHGQEPIDWRIV